MTDESEEMAETAAKLDSAMDEADETASGASGSETESDDSAVFAESLQRGLRDGVATNLGEETTESTGEGLGEQFGRLLGELVVRALSEQVRGMQDTDESDLDPSELLQREADGESLPETVGDSILGEIEDDMEDGRDVLEEAGELLETVEMSQLADAVETSELPAVIDAGEVPAAIANADPERAVELRQLASLVAFDDLWEAVDVREFMRNKEELEDAADDVTDDEDDSGMLESVGSDSASAEDDSGMLESVDPRGSSDSVDSTDSAGSLVEQEEAMQAAIQSKLREAIEEFRESVLDARENVKEARDTASQKVEAKTGGGTGQPASRNPTAYSTMVSGWKGGGWSSAVHSTVPAETRHSGAPNHDRIYGPRFDERDGRGDDDE